MNQRQVARSELRAATADDHAHVDGIFSRFDLSRQDGYVRFLRAQAAAFLPLEAAITAAGPTGILPDWDRRRRSSLLLADLAALGVTLDTAGDAPSLVGAPEVLGTVYVLEGSRLGGAMLAGSLPPDFPRGFLDAGDSGLWRSLIALLDVALVSADDRVAAIGAAHAAFAAFERGARHQLELVDLA